MSKELDSLRQNLSDKDQQISSLNADLEQKKLFLNELDG